MFGKVSLCWPGKPRASVHDCHATPPFSGITRDGAGHDRRMVRGYEAERFMGPKGARTGVKDQQVKIGSSAGKGPQDSESVEQAIGWMRPSPGMSETVKAAAPNALPSASKPGCVGRVGSSVEPIGGTGVITQRLNAAAAFCDFANS
jgi:hypothetical protein